MDETVDPRNPTISPGKAPVGIVDMANLAHRTERPFRFDQRADDLGYSSLPAQCRAGFKPGQISARDAFALTMSSPAGGRARRQQVHQSLLDLLELRFSRPMAVDPSRSASAWPADLRRIFSDLGMICDPMW